ncbi:MULTISPECIES: NADH-quinone oxidoreductase subunit 5 family protein [Thiorhodovibrio]|uniref:NADH-quinone oxidoreductase subunit 5 family protein n=1 Tax=Thiorhodovibrio TaxID=61593 RepID=UPI001913F0CE|nr:MULTISPECIES: proton-conducting transporter membrane subunit [Thiorhodovibrio]MBK5971264.1 oxidoreductase [Thiorhodovibrio winogradskyi]WPL13912.1 NADH-quinone oxidoreductase subunit L [Thiorhodovibrio litoralis]
MAPLAYALPLVMLASMLAVRLSAARLGESVARISVGASALTLALALVLFVDQLGADSARLVGVGLGLFTLYVDWLSTLMALLVGGVSLVVHVFSVRYMQDDPAYVRFFILLDGIVAVILLMVMAGDLLTLLLAWHLVGVFLYFLLNHDTRRPASTRYAFWTLFTHRIGDLPLLAAVALIHHAFGTLSLPAVFAAMAATPGTTTLLGLPLAETLGVLILIAAFAKSAQFPLHTWLPYTMDGPTPVSALMHAGIVNSGGFLINRFAPVFVHTDGVLLLALGIGLITTIMGSLMMLMQSDIKKALGYSTMGQMGYMVMECGLGAFSLAIYHLIAHGVFKATLFLGSGAIIGKARKDPNIPEGEIYKFMVERKVPHPPVSWVIFAGITITVPLLIVFGAHQLVDEGFLHHQGALILLLFGWITGAQTLFFVYKIGGEQPFKLLLYVVLSFGLVILTYVLVGHAFDALLYPDPAFREALYRAASINFASFLPVLLVLIALIAGGWLLVFRATAEPLNRRWREAYISLYALMSREFYIADLYSRAGETLLAASKRVNARLRWL